MMHNDSKHVLCYNVMIENRLIGSIFLCISNRLVDEEILLEVEFHCWRRWCLALGVFLEKLVPHLYYTLHLTFKSNALCIQIYYFTWELSLFEKITF